MGYRNAIRVGKAVSLSYSDHWLSFDWEVDFVYLAADPEGFIYASSNVPTTDTVIKGRAVGRAFYPFKNLESSIVRYNIEGLN